MRLAFDLDFYLQGKRIYSDDQHRQNYWYNFEIEAEFRIICPYEITKVRTAYLMQDHAFRVEAAEWCNANCESYWCDAMQLQRWHSLIWLFENEQEALMFKLSIL